MSGLLVLAIVGVLVGAALGTAELVRRSRERGLLEEQEERHQSNLSALRDEIADLRGTLAKMTEAPAPGTSAKPSADAYSSPAEPPNGPATAATAFARAHSSSKPQFTQPVELGSAAVEPFEVPQSRTDRPRPPSQADLLSFKQRPKGVAIPYLVEQLREALDLGQVLEFDWGAPTGIAIILGGVGLVCLSMLLPLEPIARAAALCTVAETLTCWGLYVESKPKCELVARIAIGVGWVVTFLFGAYALYYVPTTADLSADPWTFPALLVLAGAMMALTWRFKSQLATGVGFVLMFCAVALSRDTFYVLCGGATLAVLVVAIALYKDWLGLEILGVILCYLNHSYWLWNVYPQYPGRPFPEFWPSTIALVLYWLIFHIPFVSRGARSVIEERVLAVAAMFNTAFLLLLMKFQANLPPLSYFALVGLGAIEFLCAVRVRGFVRIRQR
jgi:hypothetical protein